MRERVKENSEERQTEDEEEKDVDEQHKEYQQTEGVVLTIMDYQLLGLDQLEHGFEVKSLCFN